MTSQDLSIKEAVFLFEDGNVLVQDPLYLSKVASCFHRSQGIVLPSFLCQSSDREGERSFHCLDVRQCLLVYLDGMKEFRRSSHLLVFAARRKASKH